MTILCLATDRTVAYLVKHVLTFEGFAVQVCRSEAALADALVEGACIVVTADPLPPALPVAAVVVALPSPFDARRLATAVRRAAARAVAGLARRSTREGAWTGRRRRKA